MLGSNGPEVEEDRGCTRAAVESERHRPVFAIYRICSEDNVSALFAVLIADRQRADGHGVAQRFAV